ncbi:probable sodium/metabolite cotransporter BASS4, chloroplastic [Momordica charantia]|uniref:Probable sodium/metabolite cotransporter BASS4, chloroplastic n=1 Tax=Momordica charantia TaxID=3673 RepID=A0A6J1C1Q3_MOMCH|nr:probable sodium/metabolite cotransporter BASS4, chloroplastic [Momordica charantia]
MAGTQSLHSFLFSSPRSNPLAFRLQISRLSSNGSLLRTSSIDLNHKRQIFRPIRACGLPDKKDEGGRINEPTGVLGSGNEVIWFKALSNFVDDNFLPLALVTAVAAGFANPSLGCLADRYYLSKFSTVGIFVVSGLTLRTAEISASVEAWPVAVYGLASILLLTPYFSRLILQIHLHPQEFVTGLAIFTCMPTTLSSGVALTQLAGGNSALALAMTVISNMLGILAIPFSISKFVADGVGITVPTKELFRSLVLMLLIPLIFGKILRESFKGVADFVDENRKLFPRINAILLSLVPWMQVSKSRSLLLMVKPEAFLVAIGMGTFLHLSLLAFNALGIRILAAVSGGSQSVFSRRRNASAVLLVASQKTLPVMVAVVEQLRGALGKSGLLVLPCVAAHIIQIIIDSFLVNFWPRSDDSSNNVKVS